MDKGESQNVLLQLDYLLPQLFQSVYIYELNMPQGTNLQVALLSLPFLISFHFPYHETV